MSTCIKCIWHVNITVVLIEDLECLELMRTNDSGTFFRKCHCGVSVRYIKGGRSFIKISGDVGGASTKEKLLLFFFFFF